MKHFRIHLILFFALALLVAPRAHAQIAPKQAPTVQPAAISAGIDTGVAPTLTERKIKVGLELRDLLTRLGTAYARIQTAITQVNATSIQTASAQAELALAGTALQQAKADIDAFDKIVISDSTVLARTTTTTALRTGAQKSETNLRQARTHLIASITALKIALLANADVE